MDRDAILSTVQTIVRDVLGLDDLVLTPATSAKDVERWDSVSNMNIIMSIEQEFGIHFGLGELDSMRNVGDIVEGVAARLG